MQAVAVDVLRRGHEPVLVEIGYDYVNGFVNECPGHWVLRGRPDSDSIEWHEGTTRSENAILSDFLEEVAAHRR